MQRRVLSAGEAAQLRDQLAADNMAPGFIHLWLWRRGWLMPPPVFLCFKFDVHMPTVIGYSLFYALYEPVYRPAMLIIAAGLALSWLANAPEVYQRFGAERLMAINVTIIGLMVLAWSIWVWPLHWQILGLVLAILKMVALFGPVLLISGFIDGRKERRLPRWPDYVEAALVTEVF
jgi:hypothetical protein